MSDKRANGKQRLDKAINSLTGKYGPRIVQSGEDLPALVIPPHISTGFASLDALTGCKGIPLGHLSLWDVLATKKLVEVNELIRNATAMKALLERMLGCECVALDTCAASITEGVDVRCGDDDAHDVAHETDS